MLLNLPTDVLHDVYDRLEVDDRMALNEALPRARRITRTRRTTSDLDRQLHSVSRGLKRVPRSRREQLMGPGGPRALRAFLNRHADDPTVSSLTARGQRSAWDDLLALVQAGAGSLPELRTFSRLHPEEDGTTSERKDVIAALLSLPPAVAVETLRAALADATAGAMLRSAVGHRPHGRFLFDMLNYRQYDIVEHLLASGEEALRADFGLSDESVVHFVADYAHILCNDADCVRFILRVFGHALSQEQRTSLLEDAVGRMDLPVVDALLLHEKTLD